MEKFCYILAVKYQAAPKHIEHVKAKIYLLEKMYETKTYSRQEILSLIDDGFSVFTATEKNNELEIGAPVEGVEINNQRYLKTVRNTSGGDNLGELPTF